MKTNSKQQFLSKTLLAFAMLFLFAASEMWAQQFIQQTLGAQYNATCGGVIKIKTAGFEAPGTLNAFVNNAGNTLGTDTYPIPGVVDWTSTTADQQVQALYYERLVVSGGTKTMLDGIFVTGEACPTPVTGYANLATYPFYIAAVTGDVTFQGTFNYKAAGDQTVWPTYNNAGAVNNYANLNIIAGGNVTIPDGLQVGAGYITGTSGLVVSGDLFLVGDNTTISTLSGVVTVQDEGTINFGAGAFLFDGNVDVTNGSLVATNGDGLVTIGSSSDLTLGATGNLNFDENTNLVITGTIANNGDGTNLLLNCLSTVTYNGAIDQLVMPTIASNPYGNLVLDNGNKEGGSASYGYDFHLCNNFTINATGGNFDIYKDNANPGKLFMQKVDASVTYGGNQEVVGSMNRVTDVTARDYTFNNAQTKLSLVDDVNNPESYELLILPGNNLNTMFDEEKDVNRNVTVDYTQDAVNNGNFKMSLQIAYLKNETTGWSGVDYTEDNLRFWEANTAVEKIGTGFEPDRTASDAPAVGDFGTVKVVEIEKATAGALPNDIDKFFASNDILLRTGPTIFYSIRDGRWSNPNTWDEGTWPKENDAAELRHMVYVGIPGPFASTAAEGNTTPESDATRYGAAGAAAKTINIVNDAVNYPNASLIIANMDNGADYIFKTSATTGTSFTNLNTAAPDYTIATRPATKGDFPTNSNWAKGLWVLPFYGGTPSSTYTAFGTNQIENSGTINNEGVIEIGQ